eukprot:6197274-Pleurochrysis_carterae.AAC.5
MLQTGLRYNSDVGKSLHLRCHVQERDPTTSMQQNSMSDSSAYDEAAQQRSDLPGSARCEWQDPWHLLVR